MTGPLNGFSSIVGLRPSSENAFVHLLTRSVVRFQAMQELGKRANKRGIALYTLVFIARSPPSKQALLQAHEIDSGGLDKSIINYEILFDPVGCMDSFSSHEMDSIKRQDSEPILHQGIIF